MKGLSTLTYRQRNRLLLLGSGALLLVITLGYLRPTWELWQETRQQEQALAELRTAPARLQALTTQVAADAERLRGYRLDTARQEGYMLNQLSQTCARHGVTLAGWSRGEATTQAGYRLNLQLAKLRGPYRALVQTVYELEYEHPLGRLASVRFALEEDRRQRRSFLYAYLYLQSITSEEHAKKLD
jgi:hypothetical protein